jgi:hypothetical protein
MPTPLISDDIRRQVFALKAQGFKNRDIGKKLGIAIGSVSNICQSEAPVSALDKKRGEFDWREWANWIKDGQKLKKKASHSQEFATVRLGDGSEPIVLVPFSDQHIGAWGTDYEALQKLTDELLTTPSVYIALLGDYAEYAIKLRSVLETTAQVIPPDMQTEFVESWFEEIWPKVAFATWDNHGVERQEKLAGESSIKKMLSKKVTYFNGIGHVDVQVGKEIYKIACSHVFKQGRSAMNPTASQVRYMRFEGQDREITMQGDTHKPGIQKYKDGPTLRVALNAGTLHVNSGYAKRYFSLFTAADYPCIVLYPDKHRMIPYWSVEEAVESLGLAGKKIRKL